MLKNIIDQFCILEIYEKRSIGDKYCELVFYNKDIEQWSKLCVDIFGQAVKPSGVKPAKDDLRLTEEYGGIFPNQILFKKDFGNSIVIVMLWPWQDAVHTTLKMAAL